MKKHFDRTIKALRWYGKMSVANAANDPLAEMVQMLNFPLLSIFPINYLLVILQITSGMSTLVPIAKICYIVLIIFCLVDAYYCLHLYLMEKKTLNATYRLSISPTMHKDGHISYYYTNINQKNKDISIGWCDTREDIDRIIKKYQTETNSMIDEKEILKVTYT